MKTIAQTAPEGRFTDMIGGFIALIIVGLLLAFAGNANGAVTVTTITSSQVPVNGDLTILGRFYGEAGNGINGTDEIRLSSTVGTVGVDYEWRLLNGLTAQESNTFTTLTLGTSQMSASVNGANGVASTGSLAYSGSGIINTLYIYVTSGTATGNRISMEGLVLQQAGLGSVPIGTLIANGGPGDPNGTPFHGFRVDFTGGTGPVTLGWNTNFERDAGPFSNAFGSSQTMNVLAVTSVPEPSGSVLAMIGLGVITLRRKR